MKTRTALFIAFGIGYILGAKAGRDRYEQLRKAYRRATANPNVRRVIDHGLELIEAGTAPARGVLSDQLSQAGQVLRDRASGNGHGN